jgi:hypothetical protein
LTIFSGHCVALLATDDRFRIVAHVAGDPRPVVYAGVPQTGFGAPVGRISNVPLDMRASAEHPLHIVTSSLSGTYPDGVNVGTVTALIQSANGVFQEGVVQLAPPLTGAREAAVLIPRTEDLSRSDDLLRQ